MPTITIMKVANPRYSKADQSMIDCEIIIEGRPGTFPFTAAPNDPELHGRTIYADLVAGKYGAIGAYVDPKVIKKVTP